VRDQLLEKAAGERHPLQPLHTRAHLDAQVPAQSYMQPHVHGCLSRSNFLWAARIKWGL